MPPSPVIPLVIRPWRASKRLRRAVVDVPTDVPSTEAIFLVLRRMRFPLIVLISILSISVLGLSLIPCVDENGDPWRMTLFDAFYFVSYTATTIGFGEIPHAFTAAQRMWVTGTIYASVTGWAYVFGSLFALLQEPAFRKAVTLQRFRAKVKGLHEPFLLLVGYGQAGRTLATALDHEGRRIVVVDADPGRLDVLISDQLANDVPNIEGDPTNPALLGLAGLGHPMCEGVLAMTDQDEMNLAVVMSANLLRPEVPVITRCSERANVQRMEDFSPEAVINPYDRYGSYLVMALQRPDTFQLHQWLLSEPGTELPPLHEELASGRWMVTADSRFGHEVAHDLRRAGLEVEEVNPEDGVPPFDGIAGFIAGVESDTTNLSMAAHARLVNPGVYLAVRQKSIHTTALLRAFEPDSVFIATDLVAFESLARLQAPTFWAFIEYVHQLPNEQAIEIRDRLVRRVGEYSPSPSVLTINHYEAPAVTRWLEKDHPVTLRDLLRNPDEREQKIPSFVFMLKRGKQVSYVPDLDVELKVGDQVGLLSRSKGLQQLTTTLHHDASLEYLCTAETVPTTWLWRKLRAARKRVTRRR